ncbi:MAG: ABC transporter ATP-binding protein [Betaproteobacteria bacterium]|nr:ABC transporter ATP-binding protein [Betaproteobacteria bacterium]
MSTHHDIAVDIRDLQVTFTGGRQPVRAVNGVDLQVRRGEVLALLGESGSGKSVTLRSLLRLHPPKQTQMSGQIWVGGEDVMAMSPHQLADHRGRVTSMIFQEPLLALDPVYAIGAQIVESIRRHEPTVTAQQAQQRALELFERVRIPSPERRLAAYPHEMSGGMRQRAIRCTLATEECLHSSPEAIRCSETHVVRCLHTAYAPTPAQSARLP